MWLETDTIEIYILSKTPNGKDNIQTTKTAQNKTAQAESQEQTSFPADGHQANQNAKGKQIADEQWQSE